MFLPLLAAGVLAAAPNPGYSFARSLAHAGPRPAATAGERRAQTRVANAFRAAGLVRSVDRFGVPGKGRSRNVVGVYESPARCLRIVMAHVDSAPRTQGAVDNASGVGVLAALAPRLSAIAPRCDVWLVSTGAEERPYTHTRDHRGSSALVRRVRRQGRVRDLRIALSLDEVGRGTRFQVKSNAARPRARVEGAVIHAVRRAHGHARWVRDAGGGNSDHREFQIRGLPGVKLGQPTHPCRELPCDRASLLQPRTFTLVRRAVERLLG
jgi:Zn-dependent M28 family amino/carboxypeptidase